MNTKHNDGGRSGSGIIAKLNMNKYPAKLILHMPDDIVDFESKSSQRVDDYIAHIADIRHELKHALDLLDFYNKLPSGYQKDWARYIYSAKRSETREKRILEMKEILAEGYKSIDLYRRRNQ